MLLHYLLYRRGTFCIQYMLFWIISYINEVIRAPYQVLIIYYVTCIMYIIHVMKYVDYIEIQNIFMTNGIKI